MIEKFISPCSPPEGYDRELLTILMEECAEVQQRAAKMLRFGVSEVQPGQPLSNADRLADEIGDLVCLMLMVQERRLASRLRVSTASLLKRDKLARFMQEER